MFKKKNYVSFSYVNNSILLSTETIQKNGFVEVWRQTKKNSHSIQILCFNETTLEFEAFDRFLWMEEPYYSKGGCFSDEGWHYKEDLWTPIKLHFTNEWLKRHLN